jgi:3-carboxy-cis,cis-muconate cycloisomerase
VIQQTKMSCSAIDSRVFRNLFGTQEIRDIFSDSAYVQCMIDAETALARAQSKLGVIPESIGDAVTTGCNIKNIK